MAIMYDETDLKEKDRAEIEFWSTVIENAVNNTVDDFDDDYTFAKEVVDNFVGELKNYLDASFRDVIVGIIDGYENDNAE